MGEFAAQLREQIAAARVGLERAREARDAAGVKSCGLLLRYLLDMGQERQIAGLGPGSAGSTCFADRLEHPPAPRAVAGRDVPAPLEWSFKVERGVGVIRLTGVLGARSADRFAAAIDLVLTHCTGTVLLDATGLTEWSPEGQAAIARLAERVAADGGRLCLCGLHTLAEFPGTDRPLPVFTDVASALAALSPTEPAE